MAEKVTLKDMTTGAIVYPQTLIDSVQDESGNLLKTLVLMLNNTTAFTPTGDYNPATKKYVDACYGPNNPPPYPVTSVNGQTGEVKTVKIILSSVAPDNMNDGDIWYKILT